MLLCYCNFNKQDKFKILQLINKFVCRFCSYSPVTQIAGISYWYFKVQINQKKSLKTICDNFLTSQNSVHLYLNHSCKKKLGITMNSVLPYHRGVLIQKGRGIGGVFNSLFRTLLPIGKAVIKSSPKLIKITAKLLWEGKFENLPKK